MTDPSENHSLSAARWIDHASDRFEEAWRSGHPIAMETLIDEAPMDFRAALLDELILIEVQLLREKGDSPTFADYQKRFPSYDIGRLRAKLEEPPTAPSASNGDAITLANPSSRIEWENDLEGQKIQYLGDYELLRFVAKGGMGIVYCARQRSLGRIVAIKLIRAGQFADANEIERFRSEATAAGKLDHPGIVPIYEVGEHEGVPFYSMAFVEGANLATQLAEGPLEPMRAAKLVSQIATAVHYAHSQGIIHRDLKPANILIDNQGLPRITDFGLAKSMQGSSDLTRSGEILGTPSFMPPEQAASQMSAIGPASDVYSLGAILFTILTGRPPFQAATPLETLLQVQKQEAIPIRQLNFNLPRDLETIVLKCLDKSPAKRYPTAQALSEELERYLAGIPILARPVSTTERTLRWCRRNPAVASLSIATVGSLLCVATIALIAYWRESSLLENQIRLTSSESAARKEEQIAKEKAIGAEKTARAERDRAHQSQESTRLNLYLSDGDRIDRLIAESNFVRAKELLDRQVPSSEDQKDFRSFDWFYRKKLLGEAEFTLRLETPIEVMAVSKDEQSLALGVEGGFVFLFDLSTRKATQLPFQMGEEHWSSLAFGEGSRMIGHGRNGSFKVWDLATRELVVHMQPSKQAFGTPFEKIDFPIPSAVDPVHSRMVGSDDQYLLALWSLDSLRPSPFPYINAGDHRARNRESGIEIANGFVDRIGEGYDWALSQAMERKEYAPTGDRSGSTNASRLGHSVTHLSFHPNGNLLASGHARGEVVAWEIDRILDKQQWNTKLKSSYSLFAQPVLSTAWSKSSKLLAATDGKKIVVLEPMSDKTKREFEVKTSECVQLSFIDDDRILLGMKSGLVEIWSLAQGLSVKSISTGTLTVTGLAVLAHSNAFVTSNADGTINIHTLPEESPALTPDLADTDKQLRNLTSVPLPRIEHLMGSVSMESGRARTRMFDHPPRIIRYSGQFDPAPHLAILDAKSGDLLKRLDIARVSSNSKETLGFELLSTTKELLTIHRNGFALWDLKTGLTRRSFDLAKEIGKEAQNYSIRTFTSDGANREEKTHFAQIVSGSIAAFCISPNHDHLYLAVDRYDSVALVSIQLDTWQAIPRACRVIFPKRDSSSQSDFSLTPIDSHRILLTSSLLPFGILWKAEANEIEVSTLQNLGSLPQSPTSIRSRVSPQIEANPSVKKTLLQWHAKILRVIDKENLRLVREIQPTSGFDYRQVWLYPEGEIFAVMCPVSNQPEIPFDTNKKPFHFARWEDKLGEWTTIIAAQTEFTPHEWIYDAGHNRLLVARDPYSLWRWDLDAATPLPDLNTPNHSIESLRIHRNGELAMLLRPWHGGNEWKRLNWTLEATKVHTEALHENGERPSSFDDATSTQPPTIWNSQEGSISLLARLPVAFSGRDNAQFFPSGRDYLSEDRSHLFSIQSQVNFVRHWARENLDGSLPIRYAPQVSFQFPMKYQPRLFALSPSGTKIALSDGATLAWAQIPFAEWKSILWGNAKGESIQSLEWNSNENQLAIGLETGDVLLHEPQTGKNDRLSRSSDGAVHDLLWLPDGLALAAACQDGSICIWDLQQRERRLQIAAHRGAAKSLAFDATKNILYSGGEDGVVRRWKGVASDDASTNTTHFAGPIQRKVQELRQTSTEATRRNRAVAMWLRDLGAKTSLSSFGFLQREAIIDLDSADELAVRSAFLTSGTQLTAEDLERFRGLTELRTLSLRDCQLPDHAISHLPPLPSLTYLDLTGIQLSELDFSVWKDAKELQTLILARCSLSDSQLETIIETFPNLTELDLRGSSLSDRSIAQLSALTRLHFLRLASTKMTDESLSSIAHLSQLVTLDLSDTTITCEQLTFLPSLKYLRSLLLRSLPLNQTSLDQSIIPWIKSIRTRGYLDVRGTSLSESQLVQMLEANPRISVHASPEIFGDHTELRSLAELGPLRRYTYGSQDQGKQDLEPIHVDGVALDLLKAIPALRQGQSITGIAWPLSQGNTPQDVTNLLAFPKLTHIRFVGEFATVQRIATLQQLPNLSSLELNLTRGDRWLYTNEVLDQIAKLSQLKNLTTDRLNSSVVQRLGKLKELRSLQSNDEAHTSLEAIGKAFPNLEHLRIAKWDDPKDQVFAKLEKLEVREIRKIDSLGKLPSLRTLILQRKIPQSLYDRYKKAFPNITIINGVGS